MPAPYKHLIFDLDGTLTDPREGIARSYVHALERLGVAAPPANEFERFIGPSLRDAFASLLQTTDPTRIELAVTLYRERFRRVGLFENVAYDAVHVTLEGLAAAGAQLWLCTSKPHVFATRILRHFGLMQLFSGVYGCELDGRFDDKAELLGQLLRREAIPTDSAVMIGDRVHDVRAAHKNGMACIGMSYGFGEAGELEAAGADILCEQFSDLPRVIAALAGGSASG